MLRDMVERGIAQLVAEAIGLPAWAPTLVKRAALGVLLFTLVFMRPVFTEGVTIFAEKRAEQIQKFMQPLIDSLITSPSDATKPGGPPND